MIALLFGVTLTGCQVHFDRDAVTFGKVESKKKKGTKKKVVKPKKTNQRVSNKTETVPIENFLIENLSCLSSILRIRSLKLRLDIYLSS